MKHLSIIGSVALVGAALFSGAASATCTGNDNGSIIRNGGFEDGTGNSIPGWTIANPSDDFVHILAGGYRRGGNQSLEAGTSKMENRISQPITGAVAGDVYTVCFWVYNEGGGNGISSFRAQWNNQDMTVIKNTITPNNGTFSYYSFNIIATGNDVLSFEERNDSSYFYLDNVDVQLCGCTFANGPRAQKAPTFQPFKH
jgi:hypothetical protein